MKVVKTQLIKWWPVLAGAILPLIWTKRWLDGFELPKILFLSLTAGVGIPMAVFKPEGLRKVNKKMLIGWVLLLTITLAVSRDQWGEINFIWGEPGRGQGIWFFVLLFLLFLEMSWFRGKDLLERVGIGWLAGAWGTVILGIWQKIEMLRGDWVLNYAGRVISSLGQPNFWSDYLLIGWALVWFSKGFGKSFKGLSLAAVLLGLWLSGSRFSLVIFLGLVLFWVLRFWGLGLWILAIYWLKTLTGWDWWAGRLAIWQRVIEKIAEKPWLGYGLGNLYQVIGNVGGLATDKAHNVFLEMWLVGGLGLLVVFVGLWLTGLGRAAKNKKNEVVLGLLVWAGLASVHVLGAVNWLWLVILLVLSGVK